MRFKSTLTYFYFVFLFTVAFLLFSCDNEHNFKEKEIVASLNYETDCLEVISPHFELYFKGLLAEKKLNESFDCLFEGIDYFQNKVAQERPGFYSITEILNLFSKLLPDSKLSLDFYEKVFKLKAEFFGGEKRYISNIDLIVFKTFLKDLKALMVSLSPYAKVISLGDGEISGENLDFSMQQITVFLNKWVLYNESSISESNIVNILIDISDEEESAFKTGGASWYRVFDLLRNAKKPGTILQTEKEVAVDKLLEVLRRAVSLNMSLGRDWLDLRKDYYFLEKEINEILKLISNSIGDKTWSLTDLLDFLKVLESLDLLPETFNDSVKNELIRLIFDKYFPDSLEDGVGEFSQLNLNLILKEWSFFKKFIRKTDQLEDHIGTTYPLELSGEEPFARLTNSEWPVLVDKKTDTLLVTDKVEEVEFSFRSLFHISWQMLAAKMLIKTYAKDDERAESLTGLELLEVRDAYQDIFEILLATDILDENSRGGWFRIFNEINLFIPTASPDNYAGLIEATEYLGYLFSGINAGDDIALRVQNFCFSYDKACVEESFKQQSRDLFLSMPTLSDYFMSAPPKESLTEWFESFEFIAKLDNNNLPYSNSLIFRGTIANQYVETIFRKFDLFKDDLIDFKDSELAYGTFKEALKLLPQVKGTVAENDDEFLFGFFSFFIKEGRLPKFRGGVPAREFTIWKRDAKKCQEDWEKFGQKKCGYKVDRSRILALLAFLTGIEFVED